MSEGYVHIEVALKQTSKKEGQPCGDVFYSVRDENGTTLLFADGIGSGIKAHIAAEMALGRLRELLRRGHSLHRAFGSVVKSMEQMRAPGRPFAAMAVARITPEGLTTALTYEAPPLILISYGMASEIQQHPLPLGGALVMESNCYLRAPEALVIMSDGITQAGLGSGLPVGWETRGVVRFINDQLHEGKTLKDLSAVIHRQALKLWQVGGDDCTVAIALCRKGRSVSLLTGPPALKAKDREAVDCLMHRDGPKVVCGGSTAELVGRELKEEIRIEENITSFLAPPRYLIKGVDLVTEGAVTLNQVYNLLGDDVDLLDEESAVTDLLKLLDEADRVNIFLGTAKNRAHRDISFKQRGVLTRDRIVPLIAEKLRSKGKFVILREI